MDLVDQLWAREQIRERLFTYCKAVDQKDWRLLRKCFGDSHEHEHGSYKGDANGFVEFAKSKLGGLEYSQHSLSNILISFSEDGLSAKAECNFSAVHRTKSAPGMPPCDWFVEGQYHDELVCEAETWLIIKRLGLNAWQRRESVDLNSG